MTIARTTPETGLDHPEDDMPEPEAGRGDVEVRRNGVLFAALGLVCLALTIAYLVRGFGGAGALSWVAALVIAGIGAVMGLSWWESRTPTLVADAFGIRIRLGHEWLGLPWASLEQVVVEPRTSILHDGRLVVVPLDEAASLDGLDARGRRATALSQRLYGAPLAVPLGMTTRVSVTALVSTLGELAGTRAAVVELAGWAPEPVVPMDAEHLERREARAELARGARDGSRMGAGRTGETRFDRGAIPREGLRIFEDLASSVGTSVSAGVSSLTARLERITAKAPDVRHSELDLVMVDGSSALALQPAETDPAEDDRTGTEPVQDELFDQEQPDAHDDHSWDVTGQRPEPVPVVAEAAPEVARQAEPSGDPEIGPRLRRAREQLGYDVRTLSERTRIQPRVIEAIEVDDFAPCGGDFYARGHLRALGGVLGVAPDEVVAAFDAHHASGPVQATRVFEAELAGGRNHERTGRRWALVLVVLLTLVLAWGLARLFTDQPQELSSPALSGSAGLASQREPITSVFGAPVPMSVRGTGAASKVVVRDHTGAVMWTGTIQSGVRKQLVGVGPFQVTAKDPDVVEVWVDGKDRGTVVSDNAVVGEQTRTFSS